jgi:hypothetical protein
MPGVADPIDRVIIALRLWAGCRWAAKTVAEGTLSGANTPTTRADAFAQIDDYARNDPVFAAGVEAAPARSSVAGARPIHSTACRTIRP